MATPPRDNSQKVTLRRSPRLSAFVVVSAVLGFFITLFLTGLYPSDPSVGFATLFAYFALYGITGTVGLGIVLWLIIDVRSRTRAQQVLVERARAEDPS